MSRRWLFLLAITAGAACSDDAAAIDAGPIDAPAPGRLSLSWTISHNSMDLTCAELSAVSVTIEIIPDGAAFGVVDSLSCTSGSGETRDLAPGLYAVRVSLDGSGGTLDGPYGFGDLTVTSGQTTAVDPVTFDVDPVGDLQFRITTPTTGNCADPGTGGGGITATTLELRDSTGTCVPTTFTIAAGAGQPAGTYASDCGGASYGCIDGDQDVSASAVRSGDHSLVVTGAVGNQDCWSKTQGFVVRSAGQLTVLNPIVLSVNSTNPQCPPP